MDTGVAIPVWRNPTLRDHSAAVAKSALAALGDSLRRWRKLRGITAEQVAERARTTRVTLRKIENGGSVSIDILMRVIMVLGIQQGILDAAEPLNSDVGRLRADESSSANE